MDKTKGIRSMQASAKCLQTESKKSSSQDVTGGKQWARCGRKREPAGGTFPPKSEVQVKPQPQRTRAFDKRPRARGSYTPKSAAPAEEEEDPPWLAGNGQPELGSVFLHGSKKQSLNHLLNFHLKSREGHASNVPDRGPGVHGKLITTAKHKYVKEQYIQANCQFLVNSSGDYRQYLNNPDALVDWALIEQINLQVNENPSCPICLYPPAAAKMTRCGHIYCWSCILHYFALSEKTWRKCPICYESIQQQDLKSVMSVSHPCYKVNETITLKLMRRARGSLVAYPIGESMLEDEQQLHHASDAQTSKIHSKLLLADRNDIMAIIEREQRELARQSRQLMDESEQCFIDTAFSVLSERQSAMAAQPQPPQVPIHGDVAPPAAKQYHYFYQAADGQHLYVHAVNVRMLEHTYGSLEKSPPTITGRIVEKEGGSMTEELRNRFRYLQHLPVTCQFEVAEISFNASIISKETAAAFAEQLEIRRRRRQKRAREEKRREKRIAEEENRQLGKIPIANIELDSQVQFPDFGSSPGASSQSTVRSDSPNSVGPQCADAHFTSGPSFAMMLSAKPQPAWPKLASAPVAIKQVKPKRAVEVLPASDSGNGDDCDEYFLAPAYKASFCDAIALAPERASLESNCESPEESSGRRKKNKKNRRKVLFATSMTYGN